MDHYDQFRIVAQAVTTEATYSSHWRRQAVSVLRVKEAVRERIGCPTAEVPWVDAALQEGVILGFWEMDVDPDNEVDIILVRKRHADTP